MKRKCNPVVIDGHTFEVEMDGVGAPFRLKCEARQIRLYRSADGVRDPARSWSANRYNSHTLPDTNRPASVLFLRDKRGRLRFFASFEACAKAALKEL